ncbi:MAG: hypothetical protein JSV19_12745 [Phycisphaerales bacterium]|nr:MAG: hypothetical protein JSV19_12745 [Phycisphaerales bacterium]
MTTTVVQRITVFPMAIPLRRKVSHAASQRTVADPVAVSIELQTGVVGYGETVPRPYVTGETVQSVVAAIRSALMQRVLELRPASFAEALEAIDALPFEADDGTPFPAARAGVELALLDAYARAFGRPVNGLVGWAGLAGFGTPGSRPRVRYSGVLTQSTPASLRKTLRLLWWYGLRHFKLKVGDPGDGERLAWAYRYLRRGIERGTASLRVDVNGAWTKDEAIDRLADWRGIPLAAVEQPLAKGREGELPVLKDLIDLRLIHDESLVTMDDAVRLRESGVADGFNIRISKCGGLLPALKLAAFARRHGILVQLGCMVGETSILSASGLRFLEMTPGVTFAEGCFGSFLLSADVVAQPLRFGCGGRLPRLGTAGLGVDVDANKLTALCPDRPIVIEL